MTKTKKQKSAFTLIEMLVVIAIIGILTTLMVSSLIKSQMNAKDTRRMSNVENVSGAISNYYSIKGTWPEMSDWDKLMAALKDAGLMDGIKKDEDGKTVYTACKKGGCSPEIGEFDAGRLCAACLTTGQCANTDTGTPTGNDSYCVFIK